MDQGDFRSSSRSDSAVLNREKLMKYAWTVVAMIALGLPNMAEAQTAQALFDAAQNDYKRYKYSAALTKLKEARKKTKESRLLRKIHDLTGICWVIRRKPYDGLRAFWQAYQLEGPPLTAASHRKAGVKQMQVCAKQWTNADIEELGSFLGYAPDADLNPIIVKQMVNSEWKCPSPPEPDPTMPRVGMPAPIDEPESSPPEPVRESKLAAESKAPPAPPPEMSQGAQIVAPVRDEGGTSLRTWSYVAGAVGVAAAAGAGTFGYLAVQTSDGSNDPGKNYDDEIDRAEQQALIANIGWGVAGAAVVTAVVLFFVGNESEDSTAWQATANGVAVRF